ncbi:hypothetical protein Pfo_027202 [Paulownia fortunei]|nr:hypothetical protein Pfo_027202 [Paulownia fortunei]
MGYSLDSSETSNINSDQSSLLALKFHITSDPYNVLTNNWTTKTSFCSWIGVTCDSRHNRVSELDISEMGLVGSIPPEIGNLSFLVHLNMRDNFFYGPIPPSIFNMSSLEVIVLTNNSLSGNLPVDICRHSLRRLRVLRLSENKFYGEIPSSLDQCSQLQEISLIYNNFTGNVPREIGNMTRLEALLLTSNNFNEEIGRLNNLRKLGMSHNKLKGHLPSTIFNISSLEMIIISNNMLTGSIPKIEKLNSSNFLALSRNQFSASITPTICNLSNLNSLWLVANHFSGTIPCKIGDLKMLQDFVVADNKLSGNIPWELFTTNIIHIEVSNNNFEGSIPECLGNLSKSLQVLQLKENHLNSLIPTTFTKGCLLETLNLNGNKLEGTLPKSLVNCGKLQVIDIENNEIQDMFPFWMETLPELRVLILKYNRFNGTILPASKTKVPFPKLQVFDISHNAFTGSLRIRYLENFRAMINVKENGTEQENWFSSYEESMEFFFQCVEHSVNRILTAFVFIDLSDNKFDGSISQSIGKLNSLKYLNLSHNSPTQYIPPSLGNLSALESLDLSSNQLVGENPWQLTRLTFLSKLNLSWNNLVGQIPQGGQFSTFDNSSYMGNSGLCGFSLTKKCKEEDVRSSLPMLSQDDDDSDFLEGFDWQVVLLGYGCGFVFGTTVSYFIFRCERPKWFVGFFFCVKYKIKGSS